MSGPKLFSLIVKEGLAPLVKSHRSLGGGMPLFPTSNYSKSFLELIPQGGADLITL